jgi:hypothetical protein
VLYKYTWACVSSAIQLLTAVRASPFQLLKYFVGFDEIWYLRRAVKVAGSHDFDYEWRPLPSRTLQLLKRKLLILTREYWKHRITLLLNFSAPCRHWSVNFTRVPTGWPYLLDIKQLKQEAIMRLVFARVEYWRMRTTFSYWSKKETVLPGCVLLPLYSSSEHASPVFCCNWPWTSCNCAHISGQVVLSSLFGCVCVCVWLGWKKQELRMELYCLFNDAVKLYTASNDRMTDEFGKIWKEAVVA